MYIAELLTTQIKFSVSSPYLSENHLQGNIYCKELWWVLQSHNWPDTNFMLGAYTESDNASAQK